ncbi:MAG: hypothetical protein J0M16_10640 [Gammaproteobacteria bacterium]|nr:hypothetical protein [Gammaproteobacteria bacterium]
MRRPPAAVLLLAVAGVVVPCLASAADDRHIVEAAVDVGAVHVSGPFTSWLDEGQGKFRFDGDDGPLEFSRAFLDYRGRITSTLAGHAVVNFQDTKDRAVDLTEAFLEWRPLPRTAWRVRSRVGAFYPKLSLENVDPGWSSPYSLSPSAINTWIGEELRTVGAEVRVSRLLDGWPGRPEFAVEGATFWANDGTGALLNWRGWALHDRQTGLTSTLPLPAVAAIEPWEPMDPTRGLEPFEEIDHKAGYYAGAEWRMGDSFRVKYVHYDNRGDPEAETADGAYAWHTRFDHVGVQFALPGDVGVIGQWLDGLTLMGEDLGPWHEWESGFDARFVLVTRAFGPHRFTVRWDDFDVQPVNDPDKYTNRDHGYAWTAAWLWDFSEHLRVGAEYVAIATDHCDVEQCAWVFSGLPRTSRQDQFLLTFRLK